MIYDMAEAARLTMEVNTLRLKSADQYTRLAEAERYISTLRTELAAKDKRIEAMISYLDHKPYCSVKTQGTIRCTCGFVGVMKDLTFTPNATALTPPTAGEGATDAK